VQPDYESNRESDQAEIRLMGLILTQAVSIGIAVAVFDAGLWLKLDDPTVNGITYSMAAFAVQGLAYYFFKMFFQQGMDEKARMASQERSRRNRYRSMEFTFDSRRQDMEMRMQEAQLESELEWMEKNPGKTPPWIQQRMTEPSMNSYDFIPTSVETTKQDNAPLSLGLSFAEEESTRLKKDGTPDKRYQKKVE